MFQKLCAGMPGRKTKSRKGFTLAELLIVVAIVAILVAIAIPVFTGALDDARKAVADANLRAAKAEASVAYLESKGATKSGTVTLDENGKSVNYDWTYDAASGQIKVTPPTA